MKKNFLSQFIRKYIKLPYLIFKSSVYDAISQDGIEHAGYLAFLSILSLFPFLIFIVSITSSFRYSEAGIKIFIWFLDSIPSGIASALTPRIVEIVNGPPQSLLTIAIIGIIWTASSAVEGIRTILNRAYRVESPPPYIWRRLLSILQFFVITLVIIVTTILLIVIPAILKKAEILFSINFRIDYDWFYLRHLIVFLVLIATSALLYRYIPNVNQRFIDTFPGSLLCIILWWVILKLFSLYLENFNQFNLVYGSLAGIIGVLMFFYLISLVFIIGAEFNYHFKRAYKKR